MKNENVETQVKKFNEYEAAIAAVKPHAELVINGIEDKEGAKVVSVARIECKKLLAKIEADRKDIKAPFLEACKTIDTKASEYKGAVAEVKKHLENEEAKIAEERQAIEDKKAEAVKAEVDRRIALILTCNVLFTGFSYQLGVVQIMQTQIESLGTEEFDALFSELQAVDNELKEAERVKIEAEKVETERLRVEREAQEKRAAELEAKEREAEKREAALKEKEEAAEKAEILRFKHKLEIEAKEKLVIETAKRAEQDKADAVKKVKEDEAKRVHEERLEIDRKAKERKEAEEKAARLAPDKEKLFVLSKAVKAIELPSMKTKEGKEAIETIKGQIAKMNDWLYSVAVKL